MVGRSNVKLSDIASFRTQFGLPAGAPTVIVAQGSNPGFTGDGDATEAILDVEWAGAVAPQAQVKFVIAANTATADGIDLAAMYAVNHNVAPVLSVSFGSCELEMGSYSGPSGGTELAFYNSLWQQAAAQGISVFVAAGDAGAAGCDSPEASTGSRRGINGICSSPYATCVGGTEFHEGSNPGQYWLGGNNAVLGTAQSYIPEVAWNEGASNGGSGLLGGGGGVSIHWTKPSWQTGPGVPSDGYRDVPDVSLTAAEHDGYLIFYNGSLMSVGGTSAASPSLASLFTIVNQKWPGSQGNINPVLYPLAIKQAQGGAFVFHDVTSGNNTVPGVTGYSAGVGFDLASGLGSVDASLLVNHWRDLSTAGTITLATTSATASVQAGQNTTVSASIAVSNGFNSAVALSVSGLPSGVTASFSRSSIAAPGAGTSSVIFAATNTAAGGTYSVTITATGGGVSTTAPVALSVIAIEPKCAFTASPSSVSMTTGQGTNIRLTCASPQGKLPAALALSASGQTTGMVVAFSPVTLAPGTGTSTLTITTTATALTGSHSLALTASGTGFSQTISLPVTVSIAPSFTLSSNSSAASVMQTASTAVAVSIADVGTFKSPTSLTLSGLPPGLTGVLAPASFAAPGSGTSTLTLRPAITTPPGTYKINIVGSGGGLVKSMPLSVTVTAAPNFSFTVSQTALMIQAGQAAGYTTLTVKNLMGNFNALINLNVTGIPSGITGSLSMPTLAAPGSGSDRLTLAAAINAAPGQYRLTITAIGGNVAQAASLLLTVLAPPTFTLKTDVTSLNLTVGASFTTTVSVVALNGFNSPVTLALGTLPAGLTATLSSTTIGSPSGKAILTVRTTGAAANGNYVISLSGTSSTVAVALPSQTAAVALKIGSVSTALVSASLNIARSHAAAVGLTASATNFSGAVTFSILGLPPQVSYTFSPSSLAGSGATSLRLSVGPSAAAGTYTLQIRTAAGGTSTETSLPLTIQ